MPRALQRRKPTTWGYLTIRLRARDFYEVIVDKGEIVLVESNIKYCTKNIEKRELKAIFKKQCARKIIVLLLAIYRGIDSE